jgi:hypothetical protein
MSTILPKWNDPKLKAGTMVRTALWLIAEVGVGNTFTKEQHRRDFSGVTQADRRLRDLRDYGWVIFTNTEDVTLRPEEQRFVRAGLAVWEPGARRTGRAGSISSKERHAAFAESDYQCRVCGIAGGELYADESGVAAVLSVSRRTFKTLAGQARTTLDVECKRCRGAIVAGVPVDLTLVLQEVRGLDALDQRTLSRWIDSGRRTGKLDRLWAAIRRLPRDAQVQLRAKLMDS